ncbi:MAG: ribosome maturation factor RimP [Flammeovirgaceae bacterium]
MVDFQKINSIIRQIAEASISDPSLFLVEVKVSGKKNLMVEVVVDGDKGITIDQCAEISRKIDNAIEEQNLIGQAFTLEVSSPGTDEPLKLWRQYKANIGRTLEIVTNAGETKKGKLIAVAASELTIEEEIPIKEGKKKKKEIVNTLIPADEIKKAIVMVSLKK